MPPANQPQRAFSQPILSNVHRHERASPEEGTSTGVLGAGDVPPVMSRRTIGVRDREAPYLRSLQPGRFPSIAWRAEPRRGPRRAAVSVTLSGGGQHCPAGRRRTPQPRRRGIHHRVRLGGGASPVRDVGIGHHQQRHRPLHHPQPSRGDRATVERQPGQRHPLRRPQGGRRLPDRGLRRPRLHLPSMIGVADPRGSARGATGLGRHDLPSGLPRMQILRLRRRCRFQRGD